ncbi:MAG: ATP-dependent Clp protease ATP-binding subunit [Acidobacteria bacterium]|nr:ATP-dependent Clp protease ATP-binding subunit [Acidobacteriota bacterium]
MRDSHIVQPFRWADSSPERCFAECSRRTDQGHHRRGWREREHHLFIDEAHTIIGAGAAMGTSSDAGNMFKSALARGELRIIGATTRTEYKEYIGEDEALSRRFRLVNVDEPTLDETREILLGLRPRLGTQLLGENIDEAINAALEMSPKYIRSLHLPDKAIG